MNKEQIIASQLRHALWSLRNYSWIEVRIAKPGLTDQWELMVGKQKQKLICSQCCFLQHQFLDHLKVERLTCDQRCCKFKYVQHRCCKFKYVSSFFCEEIFRLQIHLNILMTNAYWKQWDLLVPLSILHPCGRLCRCKSHTRLSFTVWKWYENLALSPHGVHVQLRDLYSLVCVNVP